MALPIIPSLGKLASILLLAAVPAALQAQEPPRPLPDSSRPSKNVLIGVVVDVVGKPMAQVEVYLAGTNRSTRTDASGRWRFSDPPSGPTVVVARRTGYVPYVREVVVGSQANDTLPLLLRRFPTRLSTVEITARASTAQADATVQAERMMQLLVSSGRLITRDEILRKRPRSIAEIIYGIPGVNVTSTPNEVVATSSRVGGGVTRPQEQQCQLQFYLNNTPIENEAMATLDPMLFRSVEVYPQVVLLTGIPTRQDKCGAIVINSLRR